MAELADDEAALRDQLVAIWQDELLLGVADPDVDFLEVDGSSLIAVRIVNRVQKLTGREMEISKIFEFSTPRTLAAALAGAEN